VSNTNITSQELKIAIEELKKHVVKCFDDQERWNHKRMEDHEAQERLMIEPIQKILERHDKLLMNPSSLDPGISVRVDRLETEKRGTSAKLGVLSLLTATNFVELLKRLFA
jgi:hypothetical protein